jgi:hypothetical protein
MQIRQEIRAQVDDFLDSLSLISDNEAVPPLRFVFEVHTDSDQGGILRSGIYQVTDTKIKIGGYEKELGKVLKEAGHSYTPEVITAITAVILKVSGPEAKRVEVLEKLLSSITDCNFLSFFVSAMNARGNINADFLGIKIGKLDEKKLSNRCRLAGSNFFELHGERFSRRFGLEMPEVKARIIKMTNSVQFRGQDNEVTKYLDNYHEKVAQDLMGKSLNQIHELQVYSYPFQKEVIESENLMEFMSVYGHENIFIFSDLRGSRTGWVGCYGRVLEVGIGNPQAAIHKFNQFQKDYNIEAVRRSSFAGLIKAACHLQRSAMAHFAANRISDAALYAFIVLEILLGEKSNVAQSLAERTAAILYGHLGVDFPRAKKTIDELYDKRSRFVHAGEQISASDCESVMEVSKELIRKVIQLAAQEEAQEENFWENWKVKVDAFASCLRAGVSGPNPFPWKDKESN